jgi:tetratricopeptide (TPR) repeat protein
MNRMILVGLVALLVTGQVFAQAQPKQRGPRPRSREEGKALTAVRNATDADARIKAAQKVLMEFKNTEYKEWLLYNMVSSAGEKEDYVQMEVYGDRLLEVNPEHGLVLVDLAYLIAGQARRDDLDKSERLAKAEGFANRALRLIPTLAKPGPHVTDELWLSERKTMMAQVHETLGIVAYLRDDYAGAEESFRRALQTASRQRGTAQVRLGRALLEQGKYDEAEEASEKAMEAGGIPAGVIRELRRDIARAKQSGGKPQPNSDAGGGARTETVKQ